MYMYVTILKGKLYRTLSTYKQIITIFGYLSFGVVFLFQPFMVASETCEKTRHKLYSAFITIIELRYRAFIQSYFYLIYSLFAISTVKIFVGPTKTKHTIYL